MIDLHMHSTFSDGTDTPAELIEKAAKLNLKTIALTDHDTLAGIPPLLEAAKHSKVCALGGLEISLEYKKSSLHLLGYLCDPDNEPLKEALGNIRDGRHYRNTRIIARLNELGIPITLEEVQAAAGDGVMARPHFARVMLEKGAVATYQEAFDDYLASGAKAYVDRYRLTLEEGVGLVRDAGGVPVLAHPALIKYEDDEELRALIERLADAGLLGIEVWYSLHSEVQTQKYKALAEEFELIATGGSDYHGTVKPGIAMGSGRGQLRVPDECAEHILAAAASDRSKCTNIA